MAWYDSSWGYRKTIYVPLANIAGTHTNFPVLIVINNDSQLLANAKSDGSDIFFTDINDTVIYPYERLSYQTGSLKAWVKFANLRSDNQDSSSVHMYYGNAAASDQQNSSSVWDANYKGVWHLSDVTGSTSYNDSTTYNRTFVAGKVSGSPMPYPNAGSAGKIFRCITFSGSQFASSSTNFLPSSSQDKTISFWALAKDIAYYNSSTFNWAMDMGGLIMGKQSSTLLYGTVPSIFTPETCEQWPFQVSENVWSYYVFTYNEQVEFPVAGHFYVYKNGAALGTPVISPVPWRPSFSGTDNYLSTYHIPTGSSPWTGSLEEVRISDTLRSANWISTEYTNQNNPASFISMSYQEATGSTPITVQWNFPFGSWNYKIPITINSGQISGSHESIPILVSMSKNASLSAGANSSGSDIIFVDATASQLLPFEILTYSTGNLVAYVRVPWISSTANNTINMYYGNAALTSSLQNANAVWSDYNLVAHLTESVSGSRLRNSVNGLVTGTAVSGAYFMTASATYPDAKMDMSGYYFPQFSANAVRPAIIFPNASTGDVGYPSTITMWASVDWCSGSKFGKPPSGSAGTLVGQRDAAASRGNSWQVGSGVSDRNSGVDNCDPVNVSCWTYNNGWAATSNFSASAAFTSQSWHYITIVSGEAQGHRVYVDAIAHGRNRVYGYTDYYNNGYPYNIGNSHGSNNLDGWSGSIALVKVGKYAATDARITTDYNNHNNPSAFITVGAEQTATAVVTASWYSSSLYKFRRKYTLPNTARQMVATPNMSYLSCSQLVDFPMLFKNSDNFLDGLIRSDAADVVFIDATDNASILPYEIISYVSGTITAWIKFPLIQYPSSNPPAFYMYFGYPSSSVSQQNSASVWMNKYAGVWHLTTGSVVGSTILDSTANANHMTHYLDLVATPPTFSKRPGALNSSQPAMFFDKVYKNLTRLPMSGSLPTGSQPRTVSIWSNLDYTADAVTRDMISLGSASATKDRMFGLREQTGRYLIGNLYGTQVAGAGDIYIDYGQGMGGWVNWWTHTAMTFEYPWATLYYYGRTTQPGTSVSLKREALNTLYTSPSKTASLMLGTNMGEPNHWTGSLEEARLSYLCRSPQWIYAEFLNQNEPLRWYNPGPIEINPAFPTSSWYDLNWKCKRKLRVSPAGVSGSNVDFPYLVAFNSDAHLRANAKLDGTDIFFTDANDSVRYAHELSAYVTGTLRAWVRLPLLDSTNGAVFNMYYGNTAATPQATASAVWDEGYVGVWHLNDNRGNVFFDSTRHQRHMYVSGNDYPQSRSAGIIDKSITFPQTSNMALSASYMGGLPTGSQSRYVSFWANPSSITNGGSPGLHVGTVFSTGYAVNGTTYASFAVTRGNNGYGAARGDYFTAEGNYTGANNSWSFLGLAGMFTASSWNYYVASYDGVTWTSYPAHGANLCRLYKNGMLVAGPTGPNNGPWNGLVNLNCRIGSEVGTSATVNSTNQEAWNGSLEDIRYCYLTRSAGWIWTEYQNQSLAQYSNTTASYMTVESQTSISPMIQNVSKILGIKSIIFT